MVRGWLRLGGSRLVLLLSLAAAAGCQASEQSSPTPAEANLGAAFALTAVRAFEPTLRANTNHRQPPQGGLQLGSDPLAIASVSGGQYALLERHGAAGRATLSLLGQELESRRRVELDGEASAMVVVGERLWIARRDASELIAFTLPALVRSERDDLAGMARFGVRALAFDRGCFYALDAEAEELRKRCQDDARIELRRTQARPSALTARDGWVAVSSALDHSVELYDPARPLGSAPLRIVHDAPIYAAELLPSREKGQPLLALGGLEDHPLDRSDGAFGNIDSFLFIYRLSDGRAEAIDALNLSEFGVLTPKVLARQADGRLLVLGFGSGRAALVDAPAAAGADSPRAQPTTFASIPGLTSVLTTEPNRFLGVSTIFDRAVRFGVDQATQLGPQAQETEEQRTLHLGEALLFTELMAPFQTSEGKASRFTCEACHFEGWGDGRKHHTGREQVYATTKPLFGLLNNPPLFTRALDPDVASMAFAEFRVALRGTGHSEWFSREQAELAWAREAPFAGPPDGPVALRVALLRTLAERPFPPNPRALRAGAWTPQVEQGQAVFERVCEGCHSARLVAQDEASRVPPAEWRSLITSPSGPIVWAREGYHQTGVLPYVHAQGARASSLRRIVEKTPYFTNGSADSLEQVVGEARFSPSAFWHRAQTTEQGLMALSADQAEALVAFLKLL